MTRKCVMCGSFISKDDAFFCLRCYSTHTYPFMLVFPVRNLVRKHAWGLVIAGLGLVLLGLRSSQDWMAILGLVLFGMVVFAR